MHHFVILLVGIHCCILGSLVTTTFANVNDGYVLSLEHAFGNGDFHERAKLYFATIRGERADVTKQLPITKIEYKLLQELSQSNGVYRIRVNSKINPTTSVSESNDAVWLHSYTYAKLLEDTNLCDDITIHTDGLGNLMAINIAPSVDGASMEADVLEFTTNVTVVMPGIAPVPDTVGYFNKIDEERKKKEEAAKEPTSFLGKYWMYIVPMVLFMMLQSAAQQQPQ